MVPFWVPKIIRHLLFWVPTKGAIIDNYPYRNGASQGFVTGFCQGSIRFHAQCGSFRKLGLPYFGVLTIRILLFGVPY